MGMDRCHVCERLVDTRADEAFYENPMVHVRAVYVMPHIN